MADFYKNSDYFECSRSQFGALSAPRGSVEGISYTVVQDLAEEPVTVSFAKEHMRIDFATDDNLVESYLKSARQYLEKFSQLSFGVKTIRFTALRVPDRWRLVNGPYTAITSQATGHTLFRDILLEGGEMVDLTLTTGWPNNDLPEAIKVSICLEAATQYMIREGVIININGSTQTPDDAHDRALKLLKPFANITFP